MLGVLRFAVRLDDLAVHDDPGRLDGERPGVQVEQVAASARQLAAPHARGRLQHPQREEPVRLRLMQEGLELVDGPDLAALAGDAGRVRVADDVPLRPAPGRELLPGPVQHAMGVDDRLGLQAVGDLLA